MNKRLALLIGIGSYTDSDIFKNLKTPQYDVEDLAIALKNFGAFDDISTIYNGNVEETKQKIEEFFVDAEKGDLTLLYFSGHGYLGDVDRKLYLAVQNTQSKKILTTGISESFIHDVINITRSKHRIIILDCCFSGKLVKGRKAGAEKVTFDVLKGEASAILASSSSAQYSYEEEGRNSLFTKYLLDGIKNSEIADERGFISINSLFDYAEKKVREARPQQTPVIELNSRVSNIYIASYTKKTPILLNLNDEISNTNKGENNVIRITNNISDGLFLEVMTSQYKKTSRLDITLNDLEVINKEVANYLKELSYIYKYEEDGEEILRRIVELGNYIYKRVFNDTSARNIIQTLYENKETTFNFVSENIMIPWQFLYINNIDENISVDNFLGMSHKIIHKVPIENIEGFKKEIITKPKVGLLADTNLQAVVQEEIPFLEKLAEEDKINLTRLELINPIEKASSMKRLKQFLEQDLDVIHFACFGSAEKGNFLDAFLTIDDFKIRMRDFQIYDIRFSGSPLIIMNSSLSRYWVGLFFNQGARSLIGVESGIDDNFASTFIKLLYQEILTGKTLSQSLLNARRKSFFEHHTILGLAYSLFNKSFI